MAFFGYGIYLAFIFTGGTYFILFKAFILPVVLIVNFFRSLKSRKTDVAAPQMYVPQQQYDAAAPYASVPQTLVPQQTTPYQPTQVQAVQPPVPQAPQG